LIENTIRPSALGRKNWLLIGHPEAGELSAIIYTLLGSCRRHGINPFDYTKDFFRRLAAANITQIKEFTPAAWTKGRSEAESGRSGSLSKPAACHWPTSDFSAVGTRFNISSPPPLDGIQFTLFPTPPIAIIVDHEETIHPESREVTRQ
jgi:hypothetical protein